MWENKVTKAPNAGGVDSLLSRVFELLSEEPLTDDTFAKLRYFLDFRKIGAVNAATRILGTHSEAIHNTILYFDSASGQFELILRDPLFDGRQATRFEWGRDSRHWPILTHHLLKSTRFRQLRDRELARIVELEGDFFSYYDGWWERHLRIIEGDPMARDVEGINARNAGTPRWVRQRARETYSENFLVARAILEHYPKQNPYSVGHANEFVSVQFLIRTDDPAGSGGPGSLRIRHDSPTPLSLDSISLSAGSVYADSEWGLKGLPVATGVGPAGTVTRRFAAGGLLLPPGKDVSFAVVMPSTMAISWQAVVRREGRVMDDEEMLLTSAWVSDHGMDFAFLEMDADAILTSRSDILLESSAAGMLRIRPGRYRVRRTITLPRGRRLVIPAGTTLEFDPGVSFVSYAPVSISGSPEVPVQFRARVPGKGWGVFAVLQTNDDGEASDVRGLRMSGSRGATHNGISFTAGLAFFKSDVDIRDSLFEDNGLDDALNVKRASMTVTGCVFRDNPSDAIDGDWAWGSVFSNLFLNNRGDAVDLSGARDVQVRDNVIVASGDKGCSVGEASRARISGNLFAYNDFGIASKDLSRTTASGNIYWMNRVALAAYRKKPIFGGGELVSEGDGFWGNKARMEPDSVSRIEARDPVVLRGPASEGPSPLTPAVSFAAAKRILRSVNTPWAERMLERMDKEFGWKISRDSN